MYRPKKYVRLDSLARTPKLSDVRNLLLEASKARSCTIELPWRSENKKLPFSLTVRLELGGGEPIWTLYEGEGNSSRVMWSTSFADVELLYDVFTLSLPSEGPTIFSPVDQKQASTKGAETDEATMRAREFFNQATEETSFSDQTMVSKPIEDGGQFLKGESSAASSTGINALTETAEVKPVEVRTTDGNNIFPDKEISLPQLPLSMPASATATGEMPAITSLPADGGVASSPPPSSTSGVFPPLGYPPYPYAYPGYTYPPYPYGYPPYPPQVPYGVAPGNPAQPYLYPPAGVDGLSTAGTVGLGSGGTTGVTGTPGPSEYMAGNVVAPHPELVKKVPNIMLGTFLLEAGLVPKATIDAALQVQALVSQGTLSAIKAAEAVRRAHLRGGALDAAEVAQPPRPNEFVVRVKPQLGQVLVMAGIISAAQLKMALQLQDEMRAGNVIMEQACERLQNLAAQTKLDTKPTNGYDEAHLERALDILKQAGVVSAGDLQEARHYSFKNRKALDQVLVETGKLDKHTIDAAVSCLEAMENKGLRIDKAIQGLFYSQRMRLPFDEAVKELGIV
jgi:hypothetical protein